MFTYILQMFSYAICVIQDIKQEATKIVSLDKIEKYLPSIYFPQLFQPYRPKHLHLQTV